MSIAETDADADADPARPLPPVISRLLRGTFWLALRTPLQAVFALWTVPLIIDTAGRPSTARSASPGGSGSCNSSWNSG